MERVLLKSARAAACRCHLCAALVKADDVDALALKHAQHVNGHGPMCGTDWVPCIQCEELARHLVRQGAQTIREQAGCDLVWQSEGAELIAGEQAALYFRAIEPGRLPLWTAPVWIADVAEIGDLVRARAEKEIYESSKQRRHAG